MIQACGDLLVIEPIWDTKVQEIYLPDHSTKKISRARGKIISIGPEFVSSDVLQAGDIIWYEKNEGTEIEYSGKKYIALKPRWLKAVEK